MLVLTITGSVLAIGTVHVAVLLAVSVVAFIGGSLGMLAFRRPPTPALVLGALGLFSLLQAVPIPAAWALRLSPISSSIWLHCLDPFREAPLARLPLSLDRGASIAEALKWFTYAAVYIMAARVRLRRGSARLATIIFASSVLVACLTLWHGASNSNLLYGVYEPHFAVARWNLGPLLNSNNLAGYINLGLFAGAGLMFSSTRHIPRGPALLGLGILATELLLSGSRAGIASAIFGASLALGWLLRRRSARPSALQILKGCAPLAAAVVAFFVLSNGQERQALGAQDIQRKIAVWRWSVPMLRDHLWFGVGRGAFETSLPPYRQALTNDWTAVYSQAENFLVQWLTEWGVLVGGFAVLAVVGYVFFEWFSARGERLRFLLLTGLVVLLIQNLADLGLEVPSLMIAAVVVAGASVGSKREPTASARSVGFIGVAGALTLFAIVWACAFTWSRWPVEDERRQASVEFRALNGDEAAEVAAFRARIRTSMLRHPGEPHFPLLGALLAFRTADENPLPWLGRALELGPTNGRVHLALAQLLGAHRAVTQAMLHLRFAAENDATLGDNVASHIAAWSPTLEVLQQGIPRGPNGASVLAEVCRLVKNGELKVECLRYAITQSPRSTRLEDLLATVLLANIRSKEPPCDGAHEEPCYREAESATQRLTKLDPKAWRPQYLEAKIFEARGDFKRAAALLAKICPSEAEGDQCARDSVGAALASGDDDAISTATEDYAARSCVGSTACAAAYDWLGSLLEAAGKSAMAMSCYSKAAEAESTVDRWLRVAKRASASRLTAIARTALDRADRSPDANGASRTTTSLLRLQVMRESTPGL